MATIDLTPKRWDLIKRLGEKQYAILDEGGDDAQMLSFEFCGGDIVQPFLDENGFDEVDPIAHYGDAFLTSGFFTLTEEQLQERIVAARSQLDTSR
jgi:hypothetical protein